MTSEEPMAGLREHQEWLSGHSPDEEPFGKCFICDTPDSIDPGTGVCKECGARAVYDEPEELRAT